MSTLRVTAAELAARRCRTGGSAEALDTEQTARYLQALREWQCENGVISKTYNFRNYHETLAFVNAIAWIAEREDHHPELVVGYNKCRVKYSTHDVRGLSENDFICAAKIDALLDL